MAVPVGFVNWVSRSLGPTASPAPLEAPVDQRLVVFSATTTMHGVRPYKGLCLGLLSHPGHFLLGSVAARHFLSGHLPKALARFKVKLGVYV